MKVRFDPEADILYTIFEEPLGTVEYYDTNEGHVLRIDKSSNKIVGMTILFFSEWIKKQAESNVILGDVFSN